MKRICKFSIILAAFFLLLVFFIHGGLSADDFKAALIGIRSDHSLNGIPTTFRGSLDVKPKGRSAKNLSEALIALSEKYGMNPAGEIARDGLRWQVQIYCHRNFVGNITTTGNGELILFQTSPYGFKEVKDYELFNTDMINLFEQYGEIRNLARFTPLAKEELHDRGVYMKMDVASQCGPRQKGTSNYR